MVSSSLAEVRYVDLNSSAPSPPYTSWATAATTIQDAVDAAEPADEILTNNSAGSGGGAAESLLIRCQLAGNVADSGGACSDATLNNCLLINNHAGQGGGAAYSTLNDCLVISLIVTASSQSGR